LRAQRKSEKPLDDNLFLERLDRAWVRPLPVEGLPNLSRMKGRFASGNDGESSPFRLHSRTSLISPCGLLIPTKMLTKAMRETLVL
jgi:hypothetical protein